MKFYAQRIKILFGIALILVICSIIAQNQTISSEEHLSQDNNQDHIKNGPTNDVKNLRASGTWNLFSIHIDDSGTSGNGTWIWAKGLGTWCTGLGTKSTPYIIENVTINGGGTGDCILIENSIVYFTIRNCTMFNAQSGENYAGIRLDNVDNGQLIDNNCSYNANNGIKLFNGCTNNTIAKNKVKNNIWGIYLEYNCDNNSISNNTACNNGDSGITLDTNCDNNTISNNTACDNANIGICFVASCYDNSVLNNNASNSRSPRVQHIGINIWKDCDYNNFSKNIVVKNNYWGIGIQSMGSYYSEYNSILGNTILDTSGSYGYGIYIQYSSRNNVSENTVINSSTHGIYVVGTGCNFNNIYNNSFINSGQNGIYLYSSCYTNTISGNIVNNSTQKGIYIYSDCDYNTISRNTVTLNHAYGIELYMGCDYNNISGNILNNNSQSGLYLHGSNSGSPLTYNDIINNTCNYNLAHGITTYSVDRSDIINNTINYNGVHGIYIYYYSDLNVISNNTITHNKEIGVYCDNNCDNNTVSNNVLNFNTYGIKVQWWSDWTFGFGNTIFNNSIVGVFIHFNSWDNQIHDNMILNSSRGVQIGSSQGGDSPYNNIYNNIITNNSVGVEVYSSNIYNNTFYNNSFINNIIHAFDNSTTSKWYKGLIGNYWDDYTGIDANDDGIGDTPYIIIYGSGGNQDNVPIWWDAPELDVNVPTPNYQIGVSAPTFEIELNKANFSMTVLWYRLWNVTYGYTTNQSISALSGTISQTLWNLMGNGTVIIQFFANDSRKYISYTNRTILKNIYVPIVDINDTILFEGIVISFNAPDFKVVLRKNLAGNALEYSWYQIKNVTTWSSKNFFSSNGTINQTLWNYQLEGSLWIYFYVNDSLGNEGSNFVLLYKDITTPQIAISSPSSYAIYGFTSPTIMLSIIEAHYDVSWYALNNFNNTIPRTGGKLNQTGWTNAVTNGTITIRFYSIDLGDNINYIDFILRIDIILPIVTIVGPGAGPWKDVAPSFQISIVESNIEEIYYVFEFEGEILITQSIGLNQEGLISEDIWNSLPNGQLKLTFYVRDKAGNLGSDVTYIIKESTESTSKGSDGTTDEGMPFWLQAAIAGAISATTGVSIKIAYARFKKDRRKVDQALVKFNKLENQEEFIKDKLKDKLDDDKWLDFEELWQKYEHQDISRRDLIAGGKKKLGDDFIQIFDEIPAGNAAVSPIARKPLKIKAKPEVFTPVVPLTEEQKKEIKKTETEVGIEAPKFNCIVHKGPIEGEIYLCPNCKALYCVKCANALKEKGEKCWSCDKEIKIEAIQKITTEAQQHIQGLEKKLEALRTSAKNIDDTYYTGALEEEEFVKMKTSLGDKIKAILEEIKQLKTTPTKAEIKK